MRFAYKLSKQNYKKENNYIKTRIGKIKKTEKTIYLPKLLVFSNYEQNDVQLHTNSSIFIQFFLSM